MKNPFPAKNRCAKHFSNADFKQTLHHCLFKRVLEITKKGAFQKRRFSFELIPVFVLDRTSSLKTNRTTGTKIGDLALDPAQELFFRILYGAFERSRL